MPMQQAMHFHIFEFFQVIANRLMIHRKQFVHLYVTDASMAANVRREEQTKHADISQQT